MNTARLILIAASAAAAGCLDPLVGAECAGPASSPCDGVCVDTRSDADNCGGCGIVCSEGDACIDGACRRPSLPGIQTCEPTACASGICLGGECLDPKPGHVVAVGHPHPGLSGGQAIGNAVFMARGANLSVLVFDAAASDEHVGRVDAAIERVAEQNGRQWHKARLLDPPRLGAALATADVFLIYHQSLAGSDAELREHGVAWADALERFLSTGGVVVLIDGPAAHHGTFQILRAAGLFEAKSREPVVADTLSVVDASDAVALDLPYTYAPPAQSVRFAGIDEGTVVEAPHGAVVVHLNR